MSSGHAALKSRNPFSLSDENYIRAMASACGDELGQPSSVVVSRLPSTIHIFETSRNDWHGQIFHDVHLVKITALRFC